MDMDILRINAERVSREDAEAYIAKLKEFALWSDDRLTCEIVDAALEGDDAEHGFLARLRAAAYRSRLTHEVQDILDGIPDFAGFVSDKFLDAVYDNWEGEPLESCYTFRQDQASAVAELWAAFEEAGGERADDEQESDLPDSILAKLRRSTTDLATVENLEKAEKEEKEERKRLYWESFNRAKVGQEKLLARINNLAAMLWNARFPKHWLPKDRGIYRLTKPNAYPALDATPGSPFWNGDPAAVGCGSGVVVEHQYLESLGTGVCARDIHRAFDLTADGYHSMAFDFHVRGDWSFGHNYGWRRIAGGVQNLEDLVEILTGRLRALRPDQ